MPVISRDSTANKTTLLSILLLLLIVAALFGKVQNLTFINFDDDRLVTANPDIRSFAPAQWVRWFTRPYVSMYVPLPMVTYALDYQLYHRWAGGYHLTNLIWHLANTLLVFMLFRFFIRDHLLAFLGALLFGIHPVQVESVAWISQRKNLLCAFFFLAGFVMWVRRTQPQEPQRRAVLPLVFFIVAALSKITAVMVPFLLMAYDYFYAAKVSRKRASLYFVLFLWVVLGSFVTLTFYPDLGRYFEKTTFGGFLAKQIYLAASYLKIIFAPWDLRLFYPASWPVARLTTGVFLSMGAVLVILLVFAYLCVRRIKAGFWMAWFILFLLPVSSLFPVPMADRHLYLPLIGILGFVISLPSEWRKLTAGILILANLFCLPIAYGRISLWQNSETFWNRYLKDQPTNYYWGILQLANYYQEIRQPARAVIIYKRLIKYYPESEAGYTNLANLLLSLRRLDETGEVADLLEARLGKTSEVYGIRAMVALGSGDRRKAVLAALKAIRMKTRNPGVYLNLGMTYLQRKHYRPAARCFRQALKLGPGLYHASFYLGISLNGLGRWTESIRVFDQMIRDKTNYPGIYFQAAYAAMKLDQWARARHLLEESIRKQPQIPEAFFYLGVMHYEEKDIVQSQKLLEKAVALKPDSKQFRTMLEKIKNASGAR